VGDYWPIKEDDEPGDGSELFIRVSPEAIDKVSVVRLGRDGQRLPL
jgi:hypothetical protein